MRNLSSHAEEMVRDITDDPGFINMSTDDLIAQIDKRLWWLTCNIVEGKPTSRQVETACSVQKEVFDHFGITGNANSKKAPFTRQHGGRRPGAGRPPSGRRSYTVNLDPQLVAMLDRFDGTRSDKIEAAVRAYWQGRRTTMPTINP